MAFILLVVFANLHRKKFICLNWSCRVDKFQNFAVFG